MRLKFTNKGGVNQFLRKLKKKSCIKKNKIDIIKLKIRGHLKYNVIKSLKRKKKIKLIQKNIRKEKYYKKLY